MPFPSQSFTRNRLLSSLSPEDFLLLQPQLERVQLQLRDPLVTAGQAIKHIHFLEGGIGSVVTERDGNEVETGLFGREGMSGATTLLGSDTTPLRSYMQIGGATSLRIPHASLQTALGQSETLHVHMLRYLQTFALQVARTAMSNALGTLPERLARWLLMCHDRVDGDEIALTHEFMAMMLAVRRAGVTVTLHALESSGAIRARRNLVIIRDRTQLEDIAGESYGMAEAEYRHLIGPFGKSQ
ncbi:Crp/Fnr family transcriptional regulator [Allosphingosinicella flava]|uniref:Crp/Fnr family transcriptional regulator n=1 Tax=Allosphingosinicella flava TaxID=2771430 RepID=A0A7T2GJI0_9SPHN|nr:Crp/Fnr family transcriptional regulator [Sphingosinicella flava]QPQ55036.1 Crp/Fnr family transcriptional regulator [Sphingosinicella flava]